MPHALGIFFMDLWFAARVLGSAICCRIFIARSFSSGMETLGLCSSYGFNDNRDVFLPS